MYQIFKELLSALNSRKAKYLIVGGYAVSYHAQPRATKDLDILIGHDPENAAAVFAALAEFGAPLEGLKPADFIEKGSFFRMGQPPLMVDIFPEIMGVDFEKAWRNRIDVTLDAETNLKAPFISDDDLIIAKQTSGRAEDIADVEALRAAKDRFEGR